MTPMGFAPYDDDAAREGKPGPPQHRCDLGVDSSPPPPDEPVEERDVTMDPAAAPAVSDQLSDKDQQLLAFERQWWKYAGAKETAIRELFDMSSTRYYQVLNGLIDSPAALAHDPLLVKRLRRLRAARQRARSARRLGVQA